MIPFTPAMPKALPSFIALITSKVVDEFKPAVACAAFPPLAAYADGLKFRYVDNVLHEATFMNLLIAPTGIGKGCVDEPVRQILSDVQRSDDENRERERQWKEECETIASTKQRPKRPSDIVIQHISADTTYAAFVKRMMEARGKYLYTHVSEIEDLMRMRNSAGSPWIYQVILNAFDNAKCGQERVGIASVSAQPYTRWTFNASTTVAKGQQFFRGQTTTGALSRVSLSTIEMPKFADMPVYGNYDDDFAAQLKVYIERLKHHPRGEIVCHEAKELIRGLISDARDNARATDNEAYFELSKRAAVIAYLKAMVLYILEGEWNEQIADFVQWNFEYDMCVKMKFFGDEAVRDFASVALGSTPIPTSVVRLEELPDPFTREDYLHRRQQHGLSTNGDPWGTIRSWRRRGCIVQNDDGTYSKTVA